MHKILQREDQKVDSHDFAKSVIAIPCTLLSSRQFLHLSTSRKKNMLCYLSFPRAAKQQV